MPPSVVLLTIPGLRAADLPRLPALTAAAPHRTSLQHRFPAVTWPAQTAMLTGRTPRQHGVVANGFYWRDSREVEMWTAWNDKIEAPQIWDRLHQQQADLTSAAWFPMLSKGCGADYVCMPAPIHNPDGSESLWCYTKPTELYGELRDALGHFPLQNFWGPLAGVASTRWIADSMALAAEKFQPRFSYVYLPHLDYQAQKHGPDSDPALEAVDELNGVLQELLPRLRRALGDELLLLAVSEYVITEVDHVCFPNRLLREAGLLEVRIEEDGEHLDLEASQAWTLVDHQLGHVFVRDSSPALCRRAAEALRGADGLDEVLVGDERAKYELDHERCGDIVLVSARRSWQAYYWWQQDGAAPGFARTVDIHRKPGYDPVELFWDREANGVPLDATLIHGSHGAPGAEGGVLLASADVAGPTLQDTDVAELVLSQFRSG